MIDNVGYEEFKAKVSEGLLVVPENSIRTTLKMEGSVDDFNGGGGKEKFVSGLAGSLGIDASQVTIRSVYSGSIVVVYDLTPAEGQSLDDLVNVHNDAIAGGTLETGYPVLDVATIRAGDTEPTTVMEGGVALATGDVRNGKTKEEYLGSLTMQDYADFLCSKLGVSLSFKNMLSDATELDFAGCDLAVTPTPPFDEVTVRHYVRETDSVTVTTKKNQISAHKLVFSSDTSLAGITVDKQQFAVVNATDAVAYPELLEDDATTTLFHVADDQVLGQKTLPENVRISYHSLLTITSDATDTSLVFEPLGPLTPVSSTGTPSIYLNFDYNQKILEHEYYTLQESIFETILIIPASLLLIFAIFSLFNIVNFYAQIAHLIKRRYTDAVEWRKLEKYLLKFKKIHTALADIDQFQPIKEEIDTFLEMKVDDFTYEQVKDATEKMAALDEMLPNLDDLEANNQKSFLKDMAKHQEAKVNAIISKRASTSLTEIIGMIKSRVSIFGMYNIHDEMETTNAKFAAELNVSNAKLELLFRQLNTRRTRKKTS